MSRSAQLDRSYQRIFRVGVALSVLVHGLILLSTRWDPGTQALATRLPMSARSEPQQLRAPEQRKAESPLELITLRLLPQVRAASPVAPPAPIASASTPPVIARAASRSEPQPDPASEPTAEQEPAPPALSYVPLPAAVLILAGGVVIPALADLDLEEVLKGDATGQAVALYQKGSVMNAKDAWVAAAGGTRREDAGVTVLFNARGGICPVRPDRGTFKQVAAPG